MGRSSRGRSSLRGVPIPLRDLCSQKGANPNPSNSWGSDYFKGPWPVTQRRAPQPTGLGFCSVPGPGLGTRGAGTTNARPCLPRAQCPTEKQMCKLPTKPNPDTPSRGGRSCLCKDGRKFSRQSRREGGIALQGAFRGAASSAMKAPGAGPWRP